MPWQIRSGRPVAPRIAPPSTSSTCSPFVNYNLGSGLAVGVSMEASASWKAQEKWTAPLLFSVSKVTLLGKRPVNLALPRAPLL